MTTMTDSSHMTQLLVADSKYDKCFVDAGENERLLARQRRAVLFPSPTRIVLSGAALDCGRVIIM